MSCTENESGPFVVFFLPAVVGCLTILLARRWANSQVSNGPTTAVSRRRKIIKDPLIKRPLPLIACKMLPPGSKKANGLIKKVSVSNVEEEMGGNGKRVNRVVRLSPSVPTSPVTERRSLEPVPPKHIPFPQIPKDGELLFESMHFVFTLLITGSQFLNLYRTMWWLPNSNTNYAMHFHLIDPHIVSFIVTLLSRRVLLSVTVTIMKMFLKPKLWATGTVAARMFILGVVLGSLSWCTYFIALKYSVLKIFFLLYPCIIYLMLFGFQTNPFLELNNSEYGLLHCCSHDPAIVRAEAEMSRDDFNMTLKKIVFNSMVGCYYTSYVPLVFVQPYVYYDTYRTAQQVCFVFGTLFCRYAAQLLDSHCYDVAHRVALHLGFWQRDEDATATELAPWNALQLYGLGVRVQHEGSVFVSKCRASAAEPTRPDHHRYYMLFKNPSNMMCVLLCMELSLIFVQICLLFSASPWHNMLSFTLLLFINYYSMFKLVREYLVSWKVYKAEHLIQDRNCSAPVT